MSSSSDAIEPRAVLSRQRSRNRIRLFRWLTVLGAIGLVVGLELLLRLLGIGQSDGLVESVPNGASGFNSRLNPDVDRVYFGGRRMIGPEPRRFAIPKPTGVYRILVLGASTVIGFPYAPELAFPRHLEILLKAHQPEQSFEVFNAGIAAINSFEVADLAGYAADCEPDVVIIHAGHNEFFGPGGPGSSVLPLPPWMVRMGFVVRRWRVGQLVNRLLFARLTADAELNPLPRWADIHFDQPEYAVVEANYRQNLEIAVRRIRKAGMPVLLTTVASNLRDQPPIRSVWPRTMTNHEVARATTLLEKVEAKMSAEQWVEAERDLQALGRDARKSARWLYRFAQVQDALGHHSDAAAGYALARDADGCPIRAPTRFGEIVRELVSDLNDPDVHLVDLEAIVARSSSYPAPGDDLFLEHVHYNQSGHHLLATHLARAIQEELRHAIWARDREPTAEEWRMSLGIIPEDEVAAARIISQTVQTPPLSSAIDAAQAAAVAEARMEQCYAELDPVRRETCADLTLREVQQELLANLIREHVKRQRWALATQFAEIATRRSPWQPQTWLTLEQLRAMPTDQRP